MTEREAVLKTDRSRRDAQQTPAETASSNDDSRRSRILNAAEQCFIASGFHGARMSQIAKAAKMSPGHIYHYFESKEQIIAEMVRAHAEEKKCMVVQFENAGDRFVDLMVENLESNVDSSTDPFWSALMLEITAEATRNPKIAAMLREADSEIKSRVIAALLDGGDRHEIDMRIEVFVALMQGLGIRNIVNPKLDKKLIAELTRNIVEILFRNTK
ncbi:MAG: TetR/AcrR family transcriptional regulator [Parvularculaceae bacterium]|nr:TetR/AcrR family transcriptional regulator [Parvularculaceae bacterium]